MSDKQDYWKELLGDDVPDGLADELGVPGMTGDSEAGEDMHLEPELFEPREGETQGDDPMSDTNVIPGDVTDFSDITQKPTQGEPHGEPFDGEFDLGEELDADEDDDMESELDEDDERAIHFARRKRTGCLGGIMYAVFILGVGIILACLGWLAADDVLALNKAERTAQITVNDNFDLGDIADDLKAEGLIEYKFLFKIFAKIFHADEKVKPGVYELSTVDYRALIVGMSGASNVMEDVDVTIPEGKTVKEIIELLVENGVASQEDLEEAAANYEYSYDFLVGRPMGDVNRLEGYLFPDTYTFYKNSSAVSALDKMLYNFELRMDANDIWELVEASPYSLHEILIIASLIEREAASGEEMPTVSSVIHNRLDINMHLGIDAALQYALPERKEILTLDDLQLDSPYNTSKYLGLPYGPIANPGVTAIMAALQPENTSYLYYALHVDGYHKFSYNQSEHDAFVNSPEFAHYGQ